MKEIKYVRPVPESLIIEFSHSLRTVNWSLMLDGSSSSDMVDMFQEMTNELQEIHFPLKKISISSYDKPWITEELKRIRRYRKRLYRKEGRSPSYLKVKDEFECKMKSEVAKYVNKIR